MKRNQQICEHQPTLGGSMVMIRVLNRVFQVGSEVDLSPLKTIRRDNTTGVILVDRPRDFGGCGKDAVKLELNVPVTHWLAEHFAEPCRCEFCDDMATTFDLAPTCDSCSARRD